MVPVFPVANGQGDRFCNLLPVVNRESLDKQGIAAVGKFQA